MSRESEKEVKKVNLMAMLTVNAIPDGAGPDSIRSWEEKVKETFLEFLQLELGYDLPEHSKKEVQMLEYYQKVVKKLKPTLHAQKGKDGLVVTGLGDLVRHSETEKLKKEIQAKEAKATTDKGKK